MINKNTGAMLVSVKCDCLARIDRGRNTLSFVKGFVTSISNETFTLDKALVATTK